ncbi:MAG: hypothetical protein ACRD5B_07990 [Nitrososphaeraceae archaeon]
MVCIALSNYAGYKKLTFSDKEDEENRDDIISSDPSSLNATTTCMTFGTDAESAADALLSSNNNTITQQCEQSISSIKGNGANYAINTVQGNDMEGGNHVDQQSKQKIGN